MKTFQNFLFVLNRFKTSSILNIVGLSVAFATFIIIMMQVDYDQNFNKFYEDSHRIYQVVCVSDKYKWAALPRPFAEILFTSPHIVAGTFCSNHAYEYYLTVDDTHSEYVEKMLRVSPSFVNIFKFDMVEGLTTALEEPDKVLIPQSIARKFFGNEPALGKTFGEGRTTIGGVYKDFPLNTSFGNIIYGANNNDADINNWMGSNYNVFVKLDKPESKKNIAKRFKDYLPEDIQKDRNADIQLINLPDLHFTPDIQYSDTPKVSRSSLAILHAIAFAILLIALINFVNFSIALVPRRIKSINTQKILGASLANQRITLASEAVFLNIFAFCLSLLLVHLVSGTTINNLTDTGADLLSHPGLITITFLISLVTGIVSGLYPAFYATSFQPAIVLKGSFGLSTQGRKMRNVLIGIQFIASLVLIISANFMYLQNKYLYRVPVGYDKDQLIVTEVKGGLRKNLDVFNNELKTFSGIEDIAYCYDILGAKDSYMGWGWNFNGHDVSFKVFPVSPSFLKMINIPITEGRDFREEDANDAFGKYIFNETAKKEYDLEINSTSKDGEEIIGFIPDIQFATFYQTPTPMAFFVSGENNWSRGQEKNTAYIKVKAGSDMFAAMEHVKNTLSAIDANYPFNVRFYDDIMNQVYQKEQRLGFLITLFSIIAIVISMVGVFGLVVFETQYRRREISIRKVFGSSIEEVMQLFGKTYLVILGICFVIACPVAYFIINKWLEKFVYKIPMYWWVFLLGGIIVLLVTVITVMTQSYKAATDNPTKALNRE